MRSRLRLFLAHLGVSAAILTLVLGGLYAGWYHWPGWFLAMARPVVIVMACVDVALGPILTLIVASPAKERRTLARDLGVIVAVQVVALVYGSVQLWHGRPMYYAYSGGILQLVQAYDLNPSDVARAHAAGNPLAPHWYSLPRWVYVPTPASPPAPGVSPLDYSNMPSLYRPWSEGLASLRGHLRPLAAWDFFIFNERDSLRRRMLAAGMDPAQGSSVPMTGRGRPVLVVFTPASMQVGAILAPL